MTPPPPTTVATLIEEILHVQSQRAQAYSQFQKGFKEYLETFAEASYQQLLATLTTEFQHLSRRALAVECSFNDSHNPTIHNPDAANIIRTLQNAEKRKLELTLSLYAVRAAVEHQKFSWQQYELQPPYEAENFSSSSGGAASGGDKHPQHPGTCHAHSTTHINSLSLEPTETDIKGALSEIYTGLEQCILDINDAIAELRELHD